MSIDYGFLRERMQEKGINQKQLAILVGVSEGQMCKKLSGEYVFKQTEILKICEILEIAAIEISLYFFTEKVEKTQQM
ncbi:MAG: DUF739 family protein [Ruminococcaceae bacterium]|nr:DUF739 family protein [Oscillospiraceae bacterium]